MSEERCLVVRDLFPQDRDAAVGVHLYQRHGFAVAEVIAPGCSSISVRVGCPGHERRSPPTGSRTRFGSGFENALVEVVMPGGTMGGRTPTAEEATYPERSARPSADRDRHPTVRGSGRLGDGRRALCLRVQAGSTRSRAIREPRAAPSSLALESAVSGAGRRAPYSGGARLSPRPGAPPARGAGRQGGCRSCPTPAGRPPPRSRGPGCYGTR